MKWQQKAYWLYLSDPRRRSWEDTLPSSLFSDLLLGFMALSNQKLEGKHLLICFYCSASQGTELGGRVERGSGGANGRFSAQTSSTKTELGGVCRGHYVFAWWQMLAWASKHCIQHLNQCPNHWLVLFLYPYPVPTLLLCHWVVLSMSVLVFIKQQQNGSITRILYAVLKV